ncbi:WSSV554 [White spot syndrome virus]|uniref:WSSV554 n=1 Tax=White spot syndrome virus TaxID=342409 RepID=A0A2I6SCK0_9VIRU|nr:WSSV554 [White spot syndrome virus]
MKCNLFHKMEKADESSNSSGESPKVKKVRRTSPSLQILTTLSL